MGDRLVRVNGVLDVSWHLNIHGDHYQILASRAISDKVAQERGYHSICDALQLRLGGFSFRQQALTPGLMIPRWAITGRPAMWSQYRPDRPGMDKDGRLKKYEVPPGTRSTVDILPSSLSALRSGSECWVSLEGHLKADAIKSAGVAATVAVVGIWSWRSQGEPIPAWKTIVDASPGRWMHIVCDSDFTTHADVPLAACRFGRHLNQLGARVRILHPPPHGTEKIGVDDYLAAGGSLDDLITVPIDDVQTILHARPERRQIAYPRTS